MSEFDFDLSTPDPVVRDGVATTPTGYGADAWGTSAYGGLPTDLGILHAWAISTNEIVVALNKPPLDRSAFLTGDVRNPGTWQVSIPAENRVLTVAGIVPHSAPYKWIVRTLEKLPPSTATCRIKAVTLKGAGGDLVAAPDYADFAGVTELAVSTPTQLAATRTAGGRDLANVPAPSISDTSVSGALVIRGGDYALVEGSELTKKLFIRRLICAPGELFHLPNYGVGIKVKQPLPAGDLIKLKAQIERQLKLERDVAAVSVAVAQSNNVLTIQARAKLAKSGQTVTVAMDSPIGQG